MKWLAVVLFLAAVFVSGYWLHDALGRPAAVALCGWLGFLFGRMLHRMFD